MLVPINDKNKGKLKYEGDYLETCSEIEVFIQVNHYYELLRKIRYCKKMYQIYQRAEDYSLASYFHDFEKKYSDEEIKELEDTLDYCILQTARFNTGVSNNPNERIEITPEFETWYQNWVNYIDNMDNETLMFYRRCRYEGKGLEQFKLNQELSLDNIEDVLNSPKVKQYYKKETENIRQKLA